MMMMKTNKKRKNNTNKLSKIKQNLTINILSAVGLFLGFLVSAAFIKLCSSTDLKIGITLTLLPAFVCKYKVHRNRENLTTTLPFVFFL